MVGLQRCSVPKQPLWNPVWLPPQTATIQAASELTQEHPLTVFRWYVIFGAAICGVSAGLYWAAEGAIILSYPPHAKRGRYLSLWLAFKNSGQLIGGAINLGLNATRNQAGKVSYVTILVFVVLQVMAFPVAFFLSPPEKTVRTDGTTIGVEKRTTVAEQLRRLWKTVTTKQIGLLLPVFFASWFYWVGLSAV